MSAKPHTVINAVTNWFAQTFEEKFDPRDSVVTSSLELLESRVMLSANPLSDMADTMQSVYTTDQVAIHVPISVNAEDSYAEAVGAPPSATILSPAIDASLSGTIAVRAEVQAGDAEIASWTVSLVDEASGVVHVLQAGTGMPESESLASFDTADFADGSMRLEVAVTDQAGNVSVASFVVTIDNAVEETIVEAGVINESIDSVAAVHSETIEEVAIAAVARSATIVDAVINSVPDDYCGWINSAKAITGTIRSTGSVDNVAWTLVATNTTTGEVTVISSGVGQPEIFGIFDPKSSGYYFISIESEGTLLGGTYLKVDVMPPLVDKIDWYTQGPNLYIKVSGYNDFATNSYDMPFAVIRQVGGTIPNSAGGIGWMENWLGFSFHRVIPGTYFEFAVSAHDGHGNYTGVLTTLTVTVNNDGTLTVF